MSFLQLLLINTVICAFIAGITYLNSRKSRIIFDLFVLCAAAAVWSLSLNVIFAARSHFVIGAWIRINHLISAFLPFFTVSLIHRFVEYKEYSKKILGMFFVCGAVLALYGISPFYFPEIKFLQAEGLVTDPAYLYSLIIFNLSAIVYCIVFLVKYRIENPERLRMPVYYIMAGLVGQYLILLMIYFWLKGDASFPWAAGGVFAASAFCAFGVFRKELPIMENFETSAIVNMLSGMLIAVFYYFIILIMEATVIREIDYMVVIPVLAASMIITMILNPLKSRVEGMVQYMFFPELGKKKEVSFNFSKEIVNIMDRKDLFNYMINTTGFLFFIKKAAVFVFDEGFGKFLPETTVGIKNPEKLQFGTQSSFVRYMEKRKHYVFWDKIKDDYRLIRIKEELEAAAEEGITLWFPLISRNTLLAFFGIGQKGTGEYFNAKDLELLSNLISGATISFENIQLYELTQRLKELDEMKKDFVSNVTHELKSPLTAIQSCADFLLKKRAGDLTRTQMDYLVIVQNNTARLTRFISALLDMAKIESAKLDLYLEEIHLPDLAGEICMLFSPYAKEKGIEVHLISKPDIPVVEVDQDKIKQVLTNLLSNAIKFTEQGEILIRIEEEGGYVKIQVSDTGVGIPPDAVGKLFNKFYQVRETHRLKHYGGTGLGLAISKGILESQGGSIEVSSELGRGTTFIIRIPKKS